MTSQTKSSGRIKRRSRKMRLIFASLAICIALALSFIYLDRYIKQQSDEGGLIGADVQINRPKDATEATTPLQQLLPMKEEGGGTKTSSPNDINGTNQLKTSSVVESRKEGAEAKPGQSNMINMYQTQISDAEQRVASLKGMVDLLQKDLEHARNQAEVMEQELVRKDSRFESYRSEIKKLERLLNSAKKDLVTQKIDASKQERQLSNELNRARDNIVSLQASLESSRGTLTELKEKFNLRERQYQTEVVSLQESVGDSNQRSEDLLREVLVRRDDNETLQAQLDSTRAIKARQHLDKAREHIVQIDSRWSFKKRKHLESALEHLHFASRVDPKNSEKYHQMALELLEEQMESIRQKRGKRAESDKRMQLLQELKEQIEGV